MAACRHPSVIQFHADWRSLPAHDTRMLPMLFAKKRTKAFHSEMRALSALLIEMGRLAESQVGGIVEVLATRSGQTARINVEQDAAIDSLQRAIDLRAVETIAR